ncbi:hypothetical protein SEA_BIG4_333 [Microbacterium phage Big4]|nr:hypothetical protein SEA_BIG4_7 [Microbacterium phage Big4]URP22366.1 hypothetical protein SEA_BIG4_333 [Microbacterium phage Big4]
MSVNGSGKDRRTNKPAQDSTSWSVKDATGTVLEAQNKKTRKMETLSGLRADEAFAAVRNFRRQGIFAGAVRS